jgi:hypothetical protein
VEAAYVGVRFRVWAGVRVRVRVKEGVISERQARLRVVHAGFSHLFI